MTEVVTEPAPRLSDRIAGSALLLTGRRLVVAIATALGGVVVARVLGPGEYGALAGAQALAGLALAAVDFGFGAYLAREFARRPDEGPRLLRATVQVQAAWAVVVALVVTGIGLSIGLDEDRGLALVVLAPGVAFAGLNGFRQIFYVLYEVRRLVWIDVPVNLLMVSAMVTIAALGGGVVGVAAAVTGGTITTALLVTLVSRRLVRVGPSDRGARREVVRISAPLGLTSFMASIYLLIDVVLLGWLVSSTELGLYAAAAKVLSFLLMVPSLVAVAALPGISTETGYPWGLGVLVARLWHWLVAISLPACVALALFAEPAARIGFGAEFVGAAPYLRVLTVAAVFAIANTVMGTLLVSHHMIRAQVVQNAVAISVNVAGNFLLVPRYGVIASAWLTVLAEAIVCAGAVWVLRGHVDFDASIDVLYRPLAAVTVAAVTAAALIWWSEPVSMIAYAVVLVGALSLFKAWPEEFRPPRLRAAT